MAPYVHPSVDCIVDRYSAQISCYRKSDLCHLRPQNYQGRVRSTADAGASHGVDECVNNTSVPISAVLYDLWAECTTLYRYDCSSIVLLHNITGCDCRELYTRRRAYPETRKSLCVYHTLANTVNALAGHPLLSALPTCLSAVTIQTGPPNKRPPIFELPASFI